MEDLGEYIAAAEKRVQRDNAAAWEDLKETIADHGGMRSMTNDSVAILLHGVLEKWEGREVAGPPRGL